jgi:uncharacterized alkaline shock family protein YloU
MAKQAEGKTVLEQTPRGGDQIAGKLEIMDDVIATVAGMAARDVPGIHALGRSRFFTFGDSPKRGVAVEVGQEEAAVDLELIIEHGCDIRKVSGLLRQKVARAIDQMAGKKVVEINITVVDIKLPEPEPEPELEPELR